MRKIELKEREKFNDKELLTTVCENHGEQGITIGEMRVLVKVLDKLQVANGELLLEDAEWTALHNRFNNFKFAIASYDLTELADSIEHASTVKQG